MQGKLAKKRRIPVNRNAGGLVDFSRLARQWVVRLNEIEQKQGVFPSIETLDTFRYGKINLRFGLVDFSRLAREMVARFKAIWQKHGVFPSIETLEGLLIFPDLLANGWSDSMKSSKNRAFSHQSKRLTRSATEKSTCPSVTP